MSLIYNLLVILPFVVFLILLFFLKTRMVVIAAISTFLLAVIALIFWQMKPLFLATSFIKGSFVALDIFFIIFGAILFLELLKDLKIIENLSYYLESISKDLRIQVILLGWFLANFLEGTAGFGTGSTVVVPLLITLGISPIKAVIIGMLGNSTAGLFGAAGTPIKIGFGQLANMELARYAVLINIAGFLVPVYILWFLVKGNKKPFKEFIEAMPFALWSGLAFSLSSVVSLYLGMEFPSIAGSLIGLALVLLTTKLGIFIPKREPDLIDSTRKPNLNLIQVTLPYLIFILFLITGKFLIEGAGLSIKMVTPHTMAFFNPGFAFLLAALGVVFIYKIKKIDFIKALKIAGVKSIEPFIVIALMSAFAQIIINSGNNNAGILSMVNILADDLRNTFLPVWAPLLGAFGSFLTGSVTVSNIMFGNFLANSALDLSLSVNKILALAAVGGAAGNMIALGDIVTAESVVGLINSERKVLKGVIIPCMSYIVLICVIGLLIT